MILCCCLAFALAAPSASALEEPRLKSTDECLLIDISTGKDLYSIQPEEYHSIASLTKIMTVLLAVEAIERGDVGLGDMVTATADVRDGMDTSSSNIDLQPGEIMSFQDLMYGALVHSGNDACNAIGIYMDGSIAAFVERMNARARELGCQSTQFIDTCGTHNRSDGHYSCARDLYKITMEAMKHSLFYQICTTVDYTLAATNVHPERDIHNSNALMCSDGLYGGGYIYQGTAGVKTGFTKPAGYCLVSTCEKNGLHLMCIVLGCNGPLTYTVVPGEYQNFMDSATLYDWAFTNFSYKTIFLAGERLARKSVQFAKDGETVALAPSQNLELLLPNEITEDQIYVQVMADEEKLVAPIAEGDVLGEVQVYISGELYTTCDAVAATGVELNNKDRVKNSIRDFFRSKGFKIAIVSLLVITVGGFALVTYLKALRRRAWKQKMASRERKLAEQRRYEAERQRRARDRYYERAGDDEPYDEPYGEPAEEPDYTDMFYEEPKKAPVRPETPPPRPSQTRWEEADLDEVLRSLGIDPDNRK